MSKLGLVESLRETKNVHYVLLARRIENNGKYSLSERQYWKQSDKLRKRIYVLFLKLIDSDTSKKLFDLDGKIAMLKSKIIGKTGWWFTGDSFMLQDNFQNMHDPEFRSFDTYRVVRTESGFEPASSSTPYNSYFASIRRAEEEFVEKNKNELDELNRSLRKKEIIMSGAFTTKNPDDYQLACAICRYLGYSDGNDLPKRYR